ncbi:hypothetical protein [Lederbergia citrea]|uniref:hypothetical protein n=1 Tax=Lederbergia citrea TaxID=2833581 RepID=UPI001BC8E5DF|nr:hypothetical protein [Lederbergia citrea]MBS4178328.1 hypothetical protein [Lederbergia citrea]MBS4205005.1 hypothetical protein [Lederbergia citrea]
MYTYDSFESLGAFTLLRPVFVTFMIISLLLFLVMLIPRFKNKFINGTAVISLSAISILVSSQLLFYSGIIVDEVGLGGDAVSTYIYLAIVGLSIINPYLFFTQRKEKNKRQDLFF